MKEITETEKIETEDNNCKEAEQYAFAQKLLSCAFYFLIGIVIFLAPFYIGLSSIISMPFFACGGIIIYVSVVSLSIRLGNIKIESLYAT